MFFVQQTDSCSLLQGIFYLTINNTKDFFFLWRWTQTAETHKGINPCTCIQVCVVTCWLCFGNAFCVHFYFHAYSSVMLVCLEQKTDLFLHFFLQIWSHELVWTSASRSSVVFERSPTHFLIGNHFYLNYINLINCLTLYVLILFNLLKNKRNSNQKRVVS